MIEDCISMKWVKGELLTEIDAISVDPTRQLGRDTQAIIFNRRAWFARVWRHFPSDAISPIIARATSEGAIAWLFLVLTSAGQAKSLSNWYSFAFNVVYKGTPDDLHKRAMITALAKRLGAAKPRLHRITMSPVKRGDNSVTCLEKAFSSVKWKAFTSQISTRWSANVEGQSFDQYWEARPGQLRSTFRRKVNKAAFDVEIFDYFNASAWAEYEDVYNDSWKPEEGSPDFIRETAEYEATAGCLRLGICRVEGVPIAAQYWTVENGTAYIHKLAHRQSAVSLSPGTILSHALFKRVIDVDRVSIIDFGTGNDAYKADWMDKSEPLDQIIFYNLRTLSGRYGAMIATAKMWIRSRYNRTIAND